ATRKSAAFLALPTNADLGLQLAWESADHLWRWAGDEAMDWNHYSKRTILSGILIPALTMRWFDGREAAEAFVARRIDNVMAFEKWKAGKDFDAPFRKATDVLGRMRYGAGGQNLIFPRERGKCQAGARSDAPDDGGSFLVKDNPLSVAGSLRDRRDTSPASGRG